MEHFTWDAIKATTSPTCLFSHLSGQCHPP